MQWKVQKLNSDESTSDSDACSDATSDSDVCSDENLVVTLYSVVIAYSDDYSSDDCSDSLYSVVVRGLCLLKVRVLDGVVVRGAQPLLYAHGHHHLRVV